MTMDELKYTRVEYERRFLVRSGSDWRPFAKPYSKTFEDKYIRDGRLRLRKLTDSDTGRQQLKLTKKFESASPYVHSLNRILLSKEEFDSLDRHLEGDQLKKVRYYHEYKGRTFSIDVFEKELEGLVLCETEAASLDDLMAAEFPPYAWREVTEDPFFTGGKLSRASHAELLQRLSELTG